MEQPILQVEHLTKFFSVGPHAEVHAVDDVNFTLRRGRTCLLYTSDAADEL